MRQSSTFAAGDATYTVRFDPQVQPGNYIVSLASDKVSTNPVAVLRRLVEAVSGFVRATPDLEELCFIATSIGSQHDPRKSAFFTLVGNEVAKAGLVAAPANPTTTCVVFTKAKTM